MAIPTRWTRITITITATTSALVLAASPMIAGPAPEPVDTSVPAQACPRIDDLARTLRAADFSAQAAKNYAVITRDDCLAHDLTCSPSAGG